jgi:transposase-like protein
MQTAPQVFSESFKSEVVEQVNKGLISKEEARRRYGIKGKSVILLWQRNYQQYGRCCVTLPTNPLPLMSKKSTQPGRTEQELQARIKELERRLEDEQLRSEGYSRIIDIAEKEYNIPIRKKPNTK